MFFKHHAAQITDTSNISEKDKKNLTDIIKQMLWGNS